MKFFELKVLPTGRHRFYFCGKHIFSYYKKYSAHATAKLIEAHKGNAFVEDLLAKRNPSSEQSIAALLFCYQKQLSTINALLYAKLPEQERDVFIRFLLKRFLRIDTATAAEAAEIEAAFQKTIALYQSRDAIDTPITFDFLGTPVRFLTNAPLHTDPSQKGALLNGYEVAHAFFMNEYSQPGFLLTRESTAAILDCGALHGDTAIAFAIQYPNTQIHSFECEPDAFGLLQKNIELNHMSNIHPVQTFLHSRKGSITIKKQSFSAMALDDYVEQHKLNPVGIIKLDVEGAEMSVLKGAFRTIHRFKPLLYIPIYHLQSDLFTIPQFIESLGYKTTFSFKWTEKRVWGMDGVLFVRFEEDANS